MREGEFTGLMKFPAPPRGLTEVQSFKSAYDLSGLFPGTALTFP